MNKVDMRKRIDSLEAKPTRKTCVKKKAPLKSEVVTELDDLKKRFCELEIENIEQIEIIKSLEIKIKELEDCRIAPGMETVSVQTDTKFVCHKCDYRVEDVYEFDAHRWIEHEDDDELDGGNNDVVDMEVSEHEIEEQRFKQCLEQFNCNLCDDNFQMKRDLMNHRKKQHTDKLANCWKFAVGTCQYGSHCWFKHWENEEEPREIKCNLCEKLFTTLSDFHTHKKQKHKQSVQICRNSNNGKCRYGVQFCWFNYEISNEEVNSNERINDKQEVLEKLFGMVEKVTERVINIENDRKENIKKIDYNQTKF